MQELQRLKAENERLKVALRKIAGMEPGWVDSPEPFTTCEDCMSCLEMQDLAEKALRAEGTAP